MKQLPKLLLTLASVLLCHAAGAQDAVNATADAAVPDVTESSTVTANSSFLGLDAFESSAVLSDDELGTQRAKEKTELADVTINDQDQNGDVTDNVAVGNTTGNNLIDGNAFSNSAGFMSTVQNSGNNVLIQNSTIINVSVDTPTD